MFDYLAQPLSERMQEMREKVRNRVIFTDAERAKIMTEADKKYGPMLPYLKINKMYRDVLEQMTCRVEDFEVLVCNKGTHFCGSSVNPLWEGGGMPLFSIEAGAWTLQDDGAYHNQPGNGCDLAMEEQDYKDLCEVREYWKGKTLNDMAVLSVPDIYLEQQRVGGGPIQKGMPLMMLPAGHLTPGFNNLVRLGYGAVRKQAADWLEAHRSRLMGDDTDKWMFYTGVVDICDGMIAVTNHYADACEAKAAETQDADRKAELLSMADGLRWIATRPPRHFREALQMVLLYQNLIFLEYVGDVGSFGRVDQYTWPFLKSDLETGYLTQEQAQEICDCFYLKINGFYAGGEGPMAKIVGIGNTYLHNTLGGVDPDTGEDASNPMTYMAMASVARMKLHDPTISLRVHRGTPDELWDYAIRVNRIVGGLPLFQNDEEIIPGIMREMGFTLRDARDYAIIGCQEITGQGNDYACCNGIIPPNTNLHYSVLLDMAINDGVNPLNNEQCSLHTGYLYDMTGIDQVKDAWKRMATYYNDGINSLNNYCEYIMQHYTPLIGLSLFMEGCMESGKDCTWGGAKYNEYGGTATGLATVADSLSAIKWACFDEEVCTTRELYDAVMADWKGHEQLQQRIINEAPHFGNGDPEADAMMDWVTNAYYEICKQTYSKRTRKFKAGLYGASDHVAQGHVTWATPDGRNFDQPIADGASPVQGRDHNGPTAVLQSANCYCHNKFMDGMALNLRIHPSALSREDGRAKLRDLTKAYMDEGGMEVQYNVVSTDDMRKAQENPDAYHDLVVRIAGYSAYFVELGRDQQDDLISRTENQL